MAFATSAIPKPRQVFPDTPKGTHGAVFTRPWVVDLILDLAGYTADKPLWEMVAIEPACGEGAFLGPMVERLSAACKRSGLDIRDSLGSIQAFDLQPGNVEKSRQLLHERLVTCGWGASSSKKFANNVVRSGDFLLHDHDWLKADFVLGNPPYIRLEAVPTTRSNAYRRVCSTMTGRADIYVGFLEIGLELLRPDGTLSFICADRWMRNQYGRLLRQLVENDFSVEAAIEMHNVDAFDDAVSAYPSVVTLRRRPQRPALVADTTDVFNATSAQALTSWHLQAKAGDETHSTAYRAAMLPSWFSSQAPWPAGSPARLTLLRELETRCPPLEDVTTGTRVGIGVATGADQVFVTSDPSAIEKDRLMPLAMVADTAQGHLEWSGNYLVSPWKTDGQGLIDLNDFPKLRSYFEENANRLKARNIAKRQSVDWFRTIDRVHPSLLGQHKLLLPDIKAEIHPVLDKGTIYPHHNLYYVTSRDWDLEILGGLLLSRVAQMFIEAYAVRMRGGYLRFQAQYLRRIRVPSMAKLKRNHVERLRVAFQTRDVALATDIALQLYELDDLPEL
ncbi:MAG TPA: Eco57I restriction-modification methylase domain-containing protein [Solirubrobacterales bacterium]|nr:Eco57I restriction-modification methylase domain-containing protein [Solirubrobacterales bacterium]